MKLKHFVDLAVIVTPSVSVPGLIGQCAEAGVLAAAKQEKLSNLLAFTSRENHAMQRVLQKAGFALTDSLEDSTVSAKMELDASSTTR